MRPQGGRCVRAIASTVSATRATHRESGLTVVEVIIALVVIAIVTAAVVTTYVSSIRNNADAGRRTQSAQLLNSLGRRVAGADASVLAPEDSPLEWDYGELGASFPELTGDGVSEPGLYRATITNLGEVSLAGAAAVRYEIVVCTRATGESGERCLTGYTAGVEPSEAAGGGGLPGIN